jgi:hypothetical protein
MDDEWMGLEQINFPRLLGYNIMLNSTIRLIYRFSSAWVDGWMDDGWMGLEQINFPHLPGRLTLFSTG